MKSKNAILADGACCWTVTGSKALFGSLRKQRKEIRLTSGNPVERLGFYVKKLKAHKCKDWFIPVKFFSIKTMLLSATKKNQLDQSYSYI